MNSASENQVISLQDLRYLNSYFENLYKFMDKNYDVLEKIQVKYPNNSRIYDIVVYHKSAMALVDDVSPVSQLLDQLSNPTPTIPMVGMGRGGTQRCKGLTQNNKRCKKMAAMGKSHCSLHK